MAITAATFTPANVTMLDKMTGVVPMEQGQAIIKEIMANSVVMQLAKYEEMTGPTKEFDVFLNGMTAYWVGEGQRIQTTKPQWGKAKMTAHKLGVILPVTREFLSYKMKDFFEKMKPALAQALYNKFDAAALLNVDNPYTQSVKQSATASTNLVTDELNLTNFDAAVSAMNDDGFEPNGAVSKTQNNTILRALVRDENGLKTRLVDGASIDGIPMLNLSKDIAEFKKGSLILGDFNNAYYGIPYNMTYSISDQATLTTLTGEDGAMLNLFERDMFALRVIMDVAFMIINDNAFAMIEPIGV